MNFAFYDFETTGTSPKFDQALQFAAILTDENLNELEVKNVRCRLSDHILPSPIAMAITEVFPDDMLSPNLSAFDFSGELSELIEDWRPAVWTGYNSLSFDENVFRQMFYQNLHPNLYATQVQGNLRLDILKAVYACWGFGRSELKIPSFPSGKLTSKLDMLAPENGFANHQAHDALGDVRATIHIAKLIRDQIPEVWETLINNLEKSRLLGKLKSGQVFQLVERFGGGAPKIYTGAYCGMSETNSNQFGFFDFEKSDVADFLSGNDELFSKAVEQSPKLIRTVDLNKMPLLFPLSDPSVEHVDAALAIQNSSAMLEATGRALAGRYADRETPDQVEAQIYEGFYSNDDKRRLIQFQNSDWNTRLTIVPTFDDARLKELGYRLVVLHAPDIAPEPFKSEFWNMIERRWAGEEFYGESERDPGNTHGSVQSDLQELLPGGKFQIEVDDFARVKTFFENRKI
jgi:exodeoxyribonuclease-1